MSRQGVSLKHLGGNQIHLRLEPCQNYVVMTMRKLLGAAVVILSFAPALAAQSAPLWEKVLIPISIPWEIHGAYGSIWRSELVITNRSLAPIDVPGVWFSCPVGGCGHATLAAQSTVFASLNHLDAQASVPGEFLLVESGRFDDLALSLRIQDVSRQALTWGTAIPAIHQDEAFHERLDLVNVPVDTRFRVHVRVYDFFPKPDRRVRLVGYEIDETVTDPLHAPQGFRQVFEVERSLTEYNQRGWEDFAIGYAQLDLAEVMIDPAVTRIGITIEPMQDNVTFWGFASVTNNETQHVTVITPN